MIGMEVDHCEVVNTSLQGQRGVDEQTLASMAVLQDRLDSLKHDYPALAGISFSSHAEKVQEGSAVLM
ncbi:hypothetical protein ACFL6U_10255 [Planctomycetota bacterium]